MDELIIECDKKITEERRDLENELERQKIQSMEQVGYMSLKTLRFNKHPLVNSRRLNTLKKLLQEMRP
jgi:hypothetical protein